MRTGTFVLGTVVDDLPWLVGLVFVGVQLEVFTAGGVEPLYSRLRD